MSGSRPLAVVGAGTAVGVVAHRRGGRRPAPEIAGRGKTLADQAGADRFAVAQHQAAADLVGKGQLADAGDGQRIEHADQQGESAEQDQGGTQGGFHGDSFTC
jgi:hypothetical protein